MNFLTAALGAVLLALSLASPGFVRAEANEPFEVYERYLAVLATADSLAPLLPFYTKDLASGLASMPAEMQTNYVKMNRRILTDLKVNEQRVESGRAQFEMTAMAADGRETRGRVTLVKEGDVWKIEDDAWVANLPGGE